MQILTSDNPLMLEIQLRLADTDSVGHVNNAAYIKFLETARTEWHAICKGTRDALNNFDWILGEIRIRFQKEAYLSDTIKVVTWVSRIGKKSWDFSYQVLNQNEDVLAYAQTSQITFDYTTKASIELPEIIKHDLLKRQGSTIPIFEKS